MSQVGVDGCKAGWIGVWRENDSLRHGIYRSITVLGAAFGEAERILIDVPIGLPWRQCPRRPPDDLARNLLGRPRKSSVFAVPCREALQAVDVATARSINLKEIGRSLSEQTWGITAKIAEVDRYVRSGSKGIHEIHPEVCFWSLAGNRPMQYKKSLPQGIEERIKVLSRFEPTTRSFVDRVLAQTLRKHLQPDDILDALVAFVTAEAKVGTLSRLVGDPTNDAEGLPLEMLFARL